MKNVEKYMSKRRMGMLTVDGCPILWVCFEVHFKAELSERLGGEEGISAITPEMDSKLKVNAVECLGIEIKLGGASASTMFYFYSAEYGGKT